jgi:hypothetical protein
LAELDRQGFVVGRVRFGRHPKLNVIAPNGRALMIVVAATAGDRWGPRNFSAELRRFARQGTASTGDPKCARLTP